MYVCTMLKLSCTIKAWGGSLRIANTYNNYNTIKYIKNAILIR